MIEQLVRTVAEHPKKPWIVTILTVVFVLVLTWPTVDSYFAAARQRATAAEKIDEHADLASRLAQLRTQLESRQSQLVAVEAATIGEGEVDDVRDQVVELIKGQGLRLRRVRLGDVATRTWFEDDSPLATSARPDTDKKTPFKLRSQPLSIQVSGPMNNVVALLNEIGAIEQATHAAGFDVRKAFEDANQVEMDLDLVFFDLIQEPAKK